MDKLSKIQREEIEAAYRLLTEETTSFGKQTTINLGESKIHELVVRCS